MLLLKLSIVMMLSSQSEALLLALWITSTTTCRTRALAHTADNLRNYRNLVHNGLTNQVPVEQQLRPR